MEQYDNDINNDNTLDRKKTPVRSKMYGRFITTIVLPTVLLLLTLISAAPTYPVQATGGSNETAATPAPGGASVGPAGGGTNVTQSDCLSQNATTNGSSIVDAGGANTTTTTTNNTTTTFAPSGASIGANDTNTLNATAGNTAGNTTGNTTTTFAPSGASIC
jgi:hypothetical protein